MTFYAASELYGAPGNLVLSDLYPAIIHDNACGPSAAEGGEGMALIAGQQILQHLRLVRPLGQGAMGSVWVADHLALGTQVALKFITPAYAQDPELVARFRREAMAAAQIKSPHVAQVFDHGVTIEGAPYIVMELLEGETLKSRIRRLGPLPVPELVRIVGQTAKALGRAHQMGIVHRDIKPDNLFLIDLDGEPFAKVLDFGIAKQQGSGELGMTSTGSMLGTPFFMSPEQILSSKHVDFRADLWALAVLTYQALTGKLPFTGETVGALSVAVHAGVFTPPSVLRPGLPAAVDSWMYRALQREPTARFASAKALAEALAQAAGEGRPELMSVSDLGAAASAPSAPGTGQQGGTQPFTGSGGTQPLSGSGALLSSSTCGRTTFRGVATTPQGIAHRRWRVLLLTMTLLGAVVVGGVAVLKGRGAPNTDGFTALSTSGTTLAGGETATSEAERSTASPVAAAPGAAEEEQESAAPAAPATLPTLAATPPSAFVGNRPDRMPNANAAAAPPAPAVVNVNGARPRAAPANDDLYLDEARTPAVTPKTWTRIHKRN